MTGTEILSVVTGAYDTVKSLGLRIIDLLAMGKVDKTEALKLKAQYEMAVQQFDFSMKQAEIWLAEKMMVGATWIKPLALTTGFAIVGVCAFNLVCKSIGITGYTVVWDSIEMIIMLAMFLYVTSGSSRALVAVIEWLIEKRKAVPDGEPTVISGNKNKTNAKKEG